MSTQAAVCGLQPKTWICLLVSLAISALIAVSVGVTMTDHSSSTPGGVAVNPSGTPQPTPAPTPAPTPSPTPAPTSPPTQAPGPLRGLKTTDFTIFHISDLHGSIGVKGRSPSYKEYNNGVTMTLDADWGDMLSMIAAARENAAASNTTEFLIFDTGDIVDGTPYSDATTPRGVNMITALSQAHYDGFAPGNHDLGYADTISLLHNTTDQLHTVTSNIDYDGQPLGQSYRVLKMKSGWNVLVLGFLFDFTPTGPDATVTNITSGQLLHDINYGGDLIPANNASRVFTNQAYFKEAMALPNIDLVITIGHITMLPNAGSVDFWDQVKKAIRKLKPHTPIIQLGGHTHKDEYTLFGVSSSPELAAGPHTGPITNATLNPIGDAPGHFGLETTNGFQTVGTIKFQLGDYTAKPQVGGQRITNLKFNWIHTNVAAMASFVNRSVSNFTIPAAVAMKNQLRSWATQYNISTIWGCWNGTTLVTNGVDPDPTGTYIRNNVYLWYSQTVMPTYFADPTPNNTAIPFYIASSSSLRGTLYNGNVTQEDLANILPFDDEFMYFKGLSAQTFQWALYYTQTKAFGSASVRKHTECIHDGDVFPPNSRVAHTPGGTYVLSFSEGPGIPASAHSTPRKRVHKLSAQLSTTNSTIHYNCSYNQNSTIPCASAQNTMGLSTDSHPYMYYSSNIPVLVPVPEMRGRTSFTYADIAGAYPTDSNKDLDYYLLAKNATARIAIRDAFLTQYANATFDLITPDYFAIHLYQGAIFAKGGATYGFPSGPALPYPGNVNNYPTSPITAIPMLHQYVNKYLTCPFPTPFTPPTVQL